MFMEFCRISDNECEFTAIVDKADWFDNNLFHYGFAHSAYIYVGDIIVKKENGGVVISYQYSQDDLTNDDIADRSSYFVEAILNGLDECVNPLIIDKMEIKLKELGFNNEQICIECDRYSDPFYKHEYEFVTIDEYVDEAITQITVGDD